MRKNPDKYSQNDIEHAGLVKRLADIKHLAIKENRVLTDEEIEQIRKELSNVENLLVLNFDETITKDLTIFTLIDILKKELTEEQLEKFEERLEKRAKILDDYRSGKSSLDRDPAIWTFYEALKDVPRKIIEKVYEEVAELEQLNPHLAEALQAIQKELGGELKIYILSLNTTRMLEIYYGKHLKKLQQMGIQVVGVMGNDLMYDESNNLTGIIEQVRRENKDKFVPPTAIMLADDSEALLRLQGETNTINIQDYDPSDVEVSLDLLGVTKDIKRLILDKEDVKSNTSIDEETRKKELNIIDTKIIKFEQKRKEYIDILIDKFNNKGKQKGGSNEKVL